MSRNIDRPCSRSISVRAEPCPHAAERYRLTQDQAHSNENRLTGLRFPTREKGLRDAVNVGNPGEDDKTSPVQLHRPEPVDELSEEAEKREFDAKDGGP